MVAVAVSDQQGTQIGYGQAQRLQAVLMRRTEIPASMRICVLPALTRVALPEEPLAKVHNVVKGIPSFYVYGIGLRGAQTKNAQGSAPAPAGPSVGVFRLLSQRG